jgi:hypothetical protein
MGITIAHPLVLLLFRDTVSSVIEKDRAAEIEVVRNGFEQLKIPRSAGDPHRARSRPSPTQRERWNESFQAKIHPPG